MSGQMLPQQKKLFSKCSRKVTPPSRTQVGICGTYFFNQLLSLVVTTCASDEWCFISYGTASII